MDYINQIERYLGGLMSQDEKKQFENKMVLQPELRNDVDNIRGIQGFLGKYNQQVDHFETEDTRIHRELLLELWDDVAGSDFTGNISKLKLLLQHRLDQEILGWLSTDAVMYRELVEGIWQDEMKAVMQLDHPDEKQLDLLREKTESVYKTCVDIDDAVDEYTFRKRAGLIDPQKLLEQLKLQQNEPEKPKVKPLLQRRWFLTAASLALLITAGGIIAGTLKSRPEDKLFGEYYTTMGVPVEFRGTELSRSGSFISGMKAYHKGDFSLSARLLGQVSSTHKQYAAARLFEGLSFMESGAYSSAVAPLEEIADGQGINLRDDARWYLALCHLKLNNQEAARTRLVQLTASASFYSKEAGHLLDDLNDH